jgi:hypothetical protein
VKPKLIAPPSNVVAKVEHGLNSAVAHRELEQPTLPALRGPRHSTSGEKFVNVPDFDSVPRCGVVNGAKVSLAPPCPAHQLWIGDELAVVLGEYSHDARRESVQLFGQRHSRMRLTIALSVEICQSVFNDEQQ